jgi:hypothetical protein
VEQIHIREEELKGLREKIKLLDELTQEAKAFDLFTPVNPPYSKLGYTEAIKDAIEKIGGNGGVTSTKMAQYILSNGFPNKGKNFPIMVDQTLRRLADRNEIITEKTAEGRRIYKKRPV